MTVDKQRELEELLRQQQAEQTSIDEARLRLEEQPSANEGLMEAEALSGIGRNLADSLQSSGRSAYHKTMDVGGIKSQAEQAGNALQQQAKGRVLFQNRMQKLLEDRQKASTQGVTDFSTREDLLSGLKDRANKDKDIEFRDGERASERSRRNALLSETEKQTLTNYFTKRGVGVPDFTGMTVGQAEESKTLVPGLTAETLEKPKDNQYSYSTSDKFVDTDGVLKYREYVSINGGPRREVGVLKADNSANDAKKAAAQSQREKMELPSQAFVKDINAADLALKGVDDLEKLVRSGLETGAWANRRNIIAGMVNIDDPAVTSLRAKLGSQLAEYIKGISGAAVSDNERAFLEGNMPTMKDSPETILQKLKDYKEITAYGRNRLIINTGVLRPGALKYPLIELKGKPVHSEADWSKTFDEDRVSLQTLDEPQSQASVAPSQASEGFVRAIGPDGKVRDIPKSEIKEFLNDGGRLQ